MFLNPTSMLLTTLLLAGSTALARPATACEGHGATPAVETAQADAAPAPAAPAEAAAPATADATAGWDALLRTFVTADGGFRYKALAADEASMAKLKAFTEQAATADASKLSREEALAFYINAYNATTIAEVLKLWPVTNVLKEDGFFDKTKHLIAGESLTLNDLEKTKIRDPYKEPRIHFLVNCASASCPILVGEAITAANLETLMARQATEYVTRTTLFKGKQGLEISSIFDWYKEDFGGPEGVRTFIAAHVAPEQRAFVADSANKIGFFNYDWNTNARD
jgi:hypothetical protein